SSDPPINVPGMVLPAIYPYVSWQALHPEDMPNPGAQATTTSVVYDYNQDASNPRPALIAAVVRIVDNLTSTTDIQVAAAHEMGHTFALDDCPRCDNSTHGTVMSYLNFFLPRAVGPTTCDVQTVTTSVYP